MFNSRVVAVLVIFGIFQLADGNAPQAQAQIIVGAGYGFSPYGYSSSSRHRNRGYGSAYGNNAVYVSPDVAQAADDAAVAGYRAQERGFKLQEQQIRLQQIKVYEERIQETENLRKLKSELTRAKVAAYQVAQAAHPPERLSSSDWDRETGAVRWPIALQTDPFAGDRAAVEQLLSRAHSGDRTPEHAASLHQLVAGMHGKLKTNIHALPPAQYVAARRFLERLDNETKLPLPA